jgi:hypothetical protein
LANLKKSLLIFNGSITERNIFIKKGFSYIKNAKFLRIPTDFMCIHQHKHKTEGGLCGGGCSIHEWRVFNKRNKLVVKISTYNDGDYPSGDLIEWTT